MEGKVAAMGVWRIVSAMALAAVAVGVSVWLVWGPGPDESAAFVASDRAVAQIAPGTVIGDREPEGWSHLVYKSSCKLASGDVQALPDFAKKLAEFLFTTMVARVTGRQQDGKPVFRLDDVAVGIGTRIGKSDVVITSDTQEKLGANLGTIQKIILSRTEEHIGKIRQVVASDVFWVVDAPSVLLLGGEHRNVILRYAFLVHPPSGQLASIVWRIDLKPDGSYERAVGAAVLVKANLVVLCPLHVDGGRVMGGIPASDAFAATQLPPGDAIELPTKILSIAGRQHLTAQEARSLDAALRDEVAFGAEK